MDKLKFAEWGEKLKTGGAQMGRALSGKWKEILQSPTPESKLVDDATSETMEEPNWGMNLKICAMINTNELSTAEIVKSIKKKISGKNPITQKLSLDLLETCTTNCEKVFSDVASENVLDEMVIMIKNPQTEDRNRQSALQLIRAWGESDNLAYLPVFHETYLSLKKRASSSPRGYDSLEPSEEEDYLASDNSGEGDGDDLNQDHGPFSINYRTMSIEKKKEFFEMTKTSLEVFSSMLDVENDDDLMITVFEECKHARVVIQMIIESTTDDNDVLFEALQLHDDLQRVISRYEELESGSLFRGSQGMGNVASHVDSPPSSSKVKRDEPQSSHNNAFTSTTA